MRTALLVLIFLSSSLALAGEIEIPKQTYVPIFRDPGETDTVVGPLWFDETPVTNQEFLLFLQSHPEFMRSRIPRLFADSGYLSHWKSETTFAKSESKFPVTHVSWFMARKYCAAQGKRLPTIAEWEVASDAQNPKLEAKILEWYGKPEAKLRNVGGEPPNKYGLRDMHGLIWEWVDNFAEAIMSGDSRGGSPMDSLFCGGAALKARDPRMYATFMRFAFRSSLTAGYESANLGFRCVRNVKEGSK